MTTEKMLEEIKTLGEPEIKFSKYTKCYYLDIPELTIMDGNIITFPLEHRKSKDEAIIAYYQLLKNYQLI